MPITDKKKLNHVYFMLVNTCGGLWLLACGCCPRWFERSYE